MANKFVADPMILRNKGKEIKEKSSEFNSNVNKIYETVEEMINSNYLDPAARALADEIKSYRDDLNAMTRTIDEYGDFNIGAGNSVEKNQDDLISDFRASSN